MNTLCENKMLSDNLAVTADGLCIGGVPLSRLAKKYGTPLYVMDEDKIRQNCRVYASAMQKYFGAGSGALYASKAASFMRVYEIVRDEGLGIDVVSQGEIYTAYNAGFPLEKAYFHSNNKTDEDIRFAMRYGVGCFVADNREELEAISRIYSQEGKKARVLLRLTPGIDPHTFEAVSTGKVDSKFGAAIQTGQAKELTALALSLCGITLDGFHCHVGSQVFDSEVYIKCADVMLGFIVAVKAELGYTARILDLGGGYGVRYVESDPVINIGERIAELAAHIKSHCSLLGIKMPSIYLEPGRSIVADSGVTLYTVGSVKHIPGYKSYVSVDGGMTDNPRYALYRSSYTILAPEMPDAKCTLECSVVGRCCESGDILQERVLLPDDIKRGDLLAVLTTGAYNYSMASNYNRIGRAAVAMVSGGEDYIAVKRESTEDIVRNDLRRQGI